MLRARLAATIVTSALIAACSAEVELAGLDQPLRVIDGHFKEGALPGIAPTTEPTETLRITAFEFATYELRPGQTGLAIGGRTTDDAWAIGIAFEGLGSGYWVHTSGFEDPQALGERRWDLTLNLGYDIPPGPHRILVVALDKDGHAGVQSALDVCVASELPDNGYACNSTVIPPAAIAVLEWNEDADLDLIVRDPAGDEVSSDRSQLAWHDVDAGANCQADGMRREAVVWNDVPHDVQQDGQHGLWAVYANLNDPRGHGAVTYRLRYYVREERDDGSFALIDHQDPIGGTFLRAQANGGAKNPTFIVQIRF